MQQIPWPSVGRDVSPIAFGAMRLIPGKDDPNSSEFVRRTEDLVAACLECGINFFDHADIYGGGKCETVFGKVLAMHPDWRDRMVLQSKCAIQFQPGHRYNHSAAYIERAVEGILQRLGVETLDVLLLHRPDPLMAPEEVAATFQRLRSAGKVQHFGVSNFSRSQMELLQSALDAPLVANQIQLSLMHPWPISEGIFVDRLESRFCGAEGVVDYCLLNKVQVQAWSPVAGGALSVAGKDDDERAVAVREAVKAAAAQLDLSPDAVGLAWLMRHPSRIVPIIGTTKPERVREAAKAAAIQMDSDLWWTLLRASLGRRVP